MKFIKVFLLIAVIATAAALSSGCGGGKQPDPLAPKSFQGT